MTGRPDGTAERRGVHRLLDLSRVYSFFQGGIGRPDGGARLREALYPGLGTSITTVLDMGCGPAAFLATNPDRRGSFRYVGFDPNPDYIETARAAYPEAELHVGTTATLGSVIEGPFDLVVASGVLHHVDDEIVRALAGFASQRLAPGGRFVTIDPVILPGQRRIARILARSDRGKHVRRPEEYEALVRAGFPGGEVTVRTIHDLLKVPYDHCVTVTEAAAVSPG